MQKFSKKKRAIFLCFGVLIFVIVIWRAIHSENVDTEISTINQPYNNANLLGDLSIIANGLIDCEEPADKKEFDKFKALLKTRTPYPGQQRKQTEFGNFDFLINISPVHKGGLFGSANYITVKLTNLERERIADFDRVALVPYDYSDNAVEVVEKSIKESLYPGESMTVDFAVSSKVTKYVYSRSITHVFVDLDFNIRNKTFLD